MDSRAIRTHWQHGRHYRAGTHAYKGEFLGIPEDVSTAIPIHIEYGIPTNVEYDSYSFSKESHEFPKNS